MPYLPFLPDDVFLPLVKTMLDEAARAHRKAEQAFGRNVVDPFAVLFEMGGFGLDGSAWLASEKARQAQKTLQNHVGAFHQSLLGSLPGWQNLGTGEVFDLCCPECSIVAELKNKHNTVKGSDKVKVYDQIAKAVLTKGHKYKGYTGYYVEIIPKSPGRYDKPFTPSDNETAQQRPANELIRQIDGYSFYALATGVPDALQQVFAALPDAIEACSPNRVIDREFAKSFFDKAFGQSASNSP